MNYLLIIHIFSFLGCIKHIHLFLTGYLMPVDLKEIYLHGLILFWLQGSVLVWSWLLGSVLLISWLQGSVSLCSWLQSSVLLWSWLQGSVLLSSWSQSSRFEASDLIVWRVQGLGSDSLGSGWIRGGIGSKRIVDVKSLSSPDAWEASF